MIAEKKSELRQGLRAQRREFICKSSIGTLFTQIAENLSQVMDPSTQVVGSYFPTKEEASPLKLKGLKPHLQWAFPKVEGEQLEFFLVENPLEQMEKGAFDILEPIPQLCERISLQSCESLLVPALAFDREGYRIGYGGGYYDRLLKNYQGQKIGVGFWMQIKEEPLPREPHDEPLDFIVNEKFVLSPLRSA